MPTCGLYPRDPDLIGLGWVQNISILKTVLSSLNVAKGVGRVPSFPRNDTQIPNILPG